MTGHRASWQTHLLSLRLNDKLHCLGLDDNCLTESFKGDMITD